MKKSKRNYIFILLILFVSFGYAYLSTNLSINGIGGFGKNTWKVYFDNIRILDGEEYANVLPVTVDDITKDLNFEVNLLKPGDSFKFLVDVVNDGSLDAMVNIISKTNVDSSYANFKISYADNIEVNGYDLLKENSHDTLVVVLEYKRDVDENIIGLVKDPIDVNVSLEYIQADENAKERERGNTTLPDGDFLNVKLKMIAGAPIFNSLNEISGTQLYHYINDEDILFYEDGVCSKMNYYEDEEASTVNMSECLNYEEDLITSYYINLENTNVKRVVRASYMDDSLKIEDNIISVDSSNVPAYAWFDNGILNYYSDSEVIYLDEYGGDVFFNFINVEDIILDTILLDYSEKLNFLFGNCNNLKNIKFINFDTSNIKDFKAFYYGCHSLNDFYLNELNFDSIESMNGMFRNTLIEYIDLSPIDTSNVIDMGWLFRDCPNLKSVDFSMLNLDNLTNLECFVYDCTSLESVNMNGIVAPNLIYLDYAFRGCTSLTNIDISSLCSENLERLDFAFCLCSSLVNLDLSSLDTSNVYNLSGIFSDCNKLANLNISNFNTSNCKYFDSMFKNCKGLASINVSHFDTRKARDFESMFYGCTKITSLDLSAFRTPELIYMSYMFAYSNRLKTVDFSNFDTSKVKYMNHLFYWCSNINNLNFSNFDTRNVLSMKSMFCHAASVTSLDLSMFDTSKVQDFSYAFSDMNRLTTLNISSFTGESCTSSAWMLENMPLLQVIDIRNFSLPVVNDATYMFANDLALTTIIVGVDFKIKSGAKTACMFMKSTLLVGGNGTVYNSSNYSGTYAKPDGYSYDSNSNMWVVDNSSNGLLTMAIA